MENDYCIVCIRKCKWIDYKSLFYIFEYRIEKVKELFKEMK